MSAEHRAKTELKRKREARIQAAHKPLVGALTAAKQFIENHGPFPPKLMDQIDAALIGGPHA